MNILSQHKAEFATLIAISLMILNANHVLIVPAEAITLITSVYLGGSAIVHGSRAIGAGLAVKGMSNVTDLAHDAIGPEGPRGAPPQAIAQVQRDQQHQAAIFDDLSKGKKPA